MRGVCFAFGEFILKFAEVGNRDNSIWITRRGDSEAQHLR